MIELIRQWCEGIIIAIILAVIIELLVPEGNNKKYVKVVIGIYIIFTIIHPMLELTNYDFEFNNIFDLGITEETYSGLDNEIKDVYILGIEQTIQNEIENLGYDVNYVSVEVDNNYETIEKIEININGKINTTEIVEPIIIGNTVKREFEYNEIIQYLEENYLVDKNQIIISS